MESLAELYLAHGAIPVRQRDDAFHVAYATVFAMDILLSWNFKHLANVRRESLIAEINRAAGYPGNFRHRQCRLRVKRFRPFASR